MRVYSKKVIYNSTVKDIKTVVDEIERGCRAEKGGIILNPDYQREYKFGNKRASQIIESILLGIPIPTIYLASDTKNQNIGYNVIDGQHRLKSIYDFIKNGYALNGLEKIPEFNGKYFDNLDIEEKNTLEYQSTLNFINIHVQDDPELELEIFKRYNMNNNPLEPQEIRHAVYNGEFNKYINNYVKELYVKDDNIELKDIFNLNKNRYLSKKLNEDLFICTYILEKGFNKKLSTSPMYADCMSRDIYELEQTNINIYWEEKENINKKLKYLNDFLKYLRKEKNIKYPLSKQIFNFEDKSLNYKLQIPILMIISCSIYVLFKNKKNDNTNFENLLNIVSVALKKHYESIEDKSSTNPKYLEEIQNYIKGEIENV